MTTTFDTPPSTLRAYVRLAARSAHQARSVASRARASNPLASDTRLTGRRLQLAAQPIVVDRLARYSRLCGFGLSGVLPATYLHVLTFPLQLQLMADPGFPLSAVGLVHVENRMIQHRPVDIRERVTLTAWADGLRPRPKGVEVRLYGEAHIDGDLVWEGVSGYLARGVRFAGLTDDEGAAMPGAAESEEALDADEPVVAQVPSGQWHPPADLGRRYAAVSGDVNPIHLSPLTARALGFPRAIAHGMWTHARSLAALEPLPPAFAATASFRRPVLLPSTVAVHRGELGRSQTLEVRTHGRPGYCLRTVTSPA